MSKMRPLQVDIESSVIALGMAVGVAMPRVDLKTKSDGSEATALTEIGFY
jgi:hypothetical protein